MEFLITWARLRTCPAWVQWPVVVNEANDPTGDERQQSAPRAAHPRRRARDADIKRPPEQAAGRHADGRSPFPDRTGVIQEQVSPRRRTRRLRAALFAGLP